MMRERTLGTYHLIRAEGDLGKQREKGKPFPGAKRPGPASKQKQ